MSNTTVYTYASLDGERDFDVELLIYWSKYRPAQGPTSRCAGQPEEGGEIFTEQIWLLGKNERKVEIPQHHRLFDYFDDMDLLHELMEFMFEPDCAI